MMVTKWYDKSESTIESVEVEVTRRIAVGRRYNISASQGYLGVIDGYVDVLALVSNPSLEHTDWGNVEDPEVAMSYIESYVQSSLDLLTDREGNREPEYNEEQYRLDNTVWVVYHYPHGQEEGILVFPIQEFVDHTSLF